MIWKNKNSKRISDVHDAKSFIVLRQRTEGIRNQDQPAGFSHELNAHIGTTFCQNTYTSCFPLSNSTYPSFKDKGSICNTSRQRKPQKSTNLEFLLRIGDFQDTDVRKQETFKAWPVEVLRDLTSATATGMTVVLGGSAKAWGKLGRSLEARTRFTIAAARCNRIEAKLRQARAQVGSMTFHRPFL
jgi:hypothetical protein